MHRILFLAGLPAALAADSPVECEAGGRWGFSDIDPGTGTYDVRIQYRENEALDAVTSPSPVHTSGGAGPTTKACDTTGTGRVLFFVFWGLKEQMLRTRRRLSISFLHISFQFFTFLK